MSDHLDPVQALLGFNGYQRVAGEVFLDWPNYSPVVSSSPDVSVEVSLEWKQGGGMRPGLIVRARQDEKEIGVCECVSCGEYSHADEAQDWLFTTWLGVSDEMQGRGWGRYLLQRALKEMHGIGCRHASISTYLW